MEEETQSAGQQTKKCPKCGEEILESAKRCKHCQADLRRWINKHPIKTFLLIIAGIAFFPILMAGISSDTNKTPKQEIIQEAKEEQKQNNEVAPVVENKEEKTISKETSPIAIIEATVKKITPNSEVTIWDSKGNFAKETTKPPYEVVVNAGKGDIASCYYAKNVAFEIMKNLYTNPAVKDKISRVIFTSWGHLRVSVGSEDGIKTDWNSSGPTNFWKVMMQYKPYEDETGPLAQRTWGKAIASDCD